MTWIIRQGIVRGEGGHLWGADPFNWSLGQFGGEAGVFTVGGGRWSANPVATTITPWWAVGNHGALRYDRRDEAYRIAAKVGGRVVRLRSPRAKDPR